MFGGVVIGFRGPMPWSALGFMTLAGGGATTILLFIKQHLPSPISRSATKQYETENLVPSLTISYFFIFTHTKTSARREDVDRGPKHRSRRADNALRICQ
jgi:hypothetical protein